MTDAPISTAHQIAALKALLERDACRKVAPRRSECDFLRARLLAAILSLEQLEEMERIDEHVRERPGYREVP